MLRLLLAFGVIVGLLLPIPGEARRSDGPRLAQTTLPHAFFIGAWEAQLTEFDRNFRIIWTLWENGRLAYHFGDLPDGPLVRGSSGSWRVTGDELHEVWERPDGTRGAGRGKVERIDENTLRLTIIDNGIPAYTGLVRIYRRIGVPQLSMR